MFQMLQIQFLLWLSRKKAPDCFYYTSSSPNSLLSEDPLDCSEPERQYLPCEQRRKKEQQVEKKKEIDWILIDDKHKRRASPK